ncbi:MAG: hypothetical protein HN390_12995 [Anaerolineae bacterium]|nr:hypothetical protein [Anaerolineae bacterium]MBT7188699.1 hypothetical protein [Anaerolineae bacterium]MBT7989841.1 hypothetical protein [Anaerolineae bacterium]
MLVQTSTPEPVIAVEVTSTYTPLPVIVSTSTPVPPLPEVVIVPTNTSIIHPTITPSLTLIPSITPRPELSISILGVSSGRTYFLENLRNGAPVYADRDFLFTEVPSFLMDENYIITANDDKFGGKDFAYTLRFHVNQEVIVYVAHDDDYSNKPDWLKSFSDTNSDLIFYVESNRIILSLYERSFPAGTISLGGNVSSSETENHAMYSVVISEK